MIAYATGLVPAHNGMLLEDFKDALAMRAGGIPDAEDWITELRQAKAAASWDALG